MREKGGLLLVCLRKKGEKKKGEESLNIPSSTPLFKQKSKEIGNRSFCGRSEKKEGEEPPSQRVM